MLKQFKEFRKQRNFKLELIISFVLLFFVISCLVLYFITKTFGFYNKKTLSADVIFLQDITFLSEWYAVFVMIFCSFKLSRMLVSKKVYVYKYTEYTFTSWSIFIFLLYMAGFIMGQAIINDDKDFPTLYRALAIHVIIPFIWVTYFSLFPLNDQKTKKQVWLGVLQTFSILCFYSLWLLLRLLPNISLDEKIWENRIPYSFISPYNIGVIKYIFVNIGIFSVFIGGYIFSYYLNKLIYKRISISKQKLENKEIIVK
ncbi:lipoprotein [Mycoplasma feriruminatoris]|uniref:lipoprotein n=1 Tax=Mycoplasma feriruminatoris TaxID=1179777 RepID=UPI00241E8EEE|nr:lipoprotein [Mycoplasma feriruminatoris]WFQ91334.1 lipoprotein [Mycoplasma feriruminatoris]